MNMKDTITVLNATKERGYECAKAERQRIIQLIYDTMSDEDDERVSGLNVIELINKK